jgi:hypothetical protein
MTNGRLNGRVRSLERYIKPAPGHCRACGLRHVRPLTLKLLRSVLRVEGGVDGAPDSPDPEPLCLCDPCCGDPRDRWFARLTHGGGPESSVA